MQDKTEQSNNNKAKGSQRTVHMQKEYIEVIQCSNFKTRKQKFQKCWNNWDIKKLIFPLF